MISDALPLVRAALKRNLRAETRQALEMAAADLEALQSKLGTARKALRDAHAEAMDQASMKSSYQDWPAFTDIVERGLGEQVKP